MNTEIHPRLVRLDRLATTSPFWARNVAKFRPKFVKFLADLGDDGVALLDASEAAYAVWNSSKTNMKNRDLYLAKEKAHSALISHMVARGIKYPS
jgi:hypothetical protein